MVAMSKESQTGSSLHQPKILKPSWEANGATVLELSFLPKLLSLYFRQATPQIRMSLRELLINVLRQPASRCQALDNAHVHLAVACRLHVLNLPG